MEGRDWYRFMKGKVLKKWKKNNKIAMPRILKNAVEIFSGWNGLTNHAVKMY